MAEYILQEAPIPISRKTHHHQSPVADTNVIQMYDNEVNLLITVTEI